MFKWIEHSPDNCSICNYFERASTGGRPKKTKQPGRPATISTRSAIDHITTIAPPSFFPLQDDLRAAIESPDEDLLCQLCSKVLDRPVHLTICNKLVCMTCLCDRLDANLICPCCEVSHIQEFSTMVPPSSIVMTVLGNCVVTCSLCKNRVASGIIIQ